MKIGFSAHAGAELEPDAVPNVLTLVPLSDTDRQRIEAVDPSVRLVDAGGWFDGEYRETWPRYAVDLYVAPDSAGKASRSERDALLAEAGIVLGGWPFPLDLRARAPGLRWFHQRPAGASNLRLGDLWGSDVVVTTSRGLANALPAAEYVVGGILHFARAFDRAAADQASRHVDRHAYRPWLLAGKTVCIVGAGGIGAEAGRLCAALGMRVVGTRRRPPEDADDRPEGFAEIGGPRDLHRLLEQSDVVAICCQWTPETTRLVDAAALAAMKPGGIVINIARGEIVDEDALVQALDAGQLGGAVLDVYVGEFEHPPPERLWAHPRILMTPHTSTGSDVNRHRSIDLFCENLRAWLAGRPLANVVDWRRGY
jgi:phosphoglycerate dehydrogenase-like enzyme